MFAELNKLRALGVQTALDDFGAGYSSLSYLNEFPFDKVKIDQSFIRDIDTPKSAKAASIIRAINAIGRDLSMCVVVEGVETQDQLAAIRALGIKGAQGHFFSRPVPVEDIGVYLLKKMAEKARSAPAALATPASPGAKHRLTAREDRADGIASGSAFVSRMVRYFRSIHGAARVKAGAGGTPVTLDQLRDFRRRRGA